MWIINYQYDESYGNNLGDIIIKKERGFEVVDDDNILIAENIFDFIFAKYDMKDNLEIWISKVKSYISWNIEIQEKVTIDYED